MTSSPDKLNIYAVPAATTLALLLVETTYLSVALPETRQWSKGTSSGSSDAGKTGPDSIDQRKQRLRTIGRLHGLFLLLFSGVSDEIMKPRLQLTTQAEFTLTFLTYDLFSASNAENGRLLSCTTPVCLSTLRHS